MKKLNYIKNYKVYLENIDFGGDEDSEDISQKKLEDFSKELSEFNSKKGNLENLIVNNVGDDKKDINNDVEKIVGENSFLKRYVSVLNKKRRINEMELRLKYYSNLKKERQDNITQTRKLTDEQDRKEQIEKLNDQISEVDESINKIEKDSKELSNEIKEDEETFKTYLDDLKSKIEEEVNKKEWKT